MKSNKSFLNSPGRLIAISLVAIGGIAGAWFGYFRNSSDGGKGLNPAAGASLSKRIESRSNQAGSNVSEASLGSGFGVDRVAPRVGVGATSLDGMLSLFDRISKRISTDGGRASFEYFRSLPPGDERRMGITESIVEISRQEGIPTAMDLIGKMGSPDVDETTITNLFVPKSEDDLARVLKGLKSVADPRVRALAVDQIAVEAEGFSAEALQALVGSSELSGEERKVAEYCYAMKMSKEDPQAIGAVFGAFTEGQQGVLLGKIVGAWPIADLEGCSEWLFSNYPNQRALADALSNMISIHGVMRPDLVMKVIEEAPASAAADRAHGQLINLLFDRDRASAEAWVSQLQLGSGRDSAIRSFMERLVREDPESAIVFAGRVAHGTDDLNRQVQQIGHMWGQVAPREALSWFEQEESLSLETRVTVRTNILCAWAMSNPQEFVLQSKEDPSMIESPKVINGLTQALALNSPGNAVKWLVDSNNAGAEDFTHLMRQWIQVEPTAASVWVRDLEDGAARDLAIESIIEAVQKDDPDLADEWEKELSSVQRHVLPRRLPNAHKAVSK